MNRIGTAGQRLGITAAVLAAVAAACGGSSGSVSTSSAGASAPTQAGGTPATGGAADITIKNFAFLPAQLSAKVGQKITVVNTDAVPHTWTADDGSFDSSTLDQGQRFSFTFTKAGAFAYTCSIHPRMKGTVTVR